MIIRNLYSLFCGLELQNGRLDSSIPPSEIVEKENTAVIIPRKFKDDIEHIAKYRVGLKYSPQKKRKNIALC